MRVLPLRKGESEADMSQTYKVKSEVWLYVPVRVSASESRSGLWHFVSLSRKQSEEIDKKYRDKRRGWSSFPVSVTLGKAKWNTSIFFDKREGAYILPLKARVRKKEDIRQGDKINFSIEILV